MILQGASWLLTCDKDNTIIENGGIVFDDKIIEIGSFDTLKEKYPNITINEPKQNSVLMPGLINSHVHLEFSANKTTLQYGNFMDWLHSVIENREILVEKATTKFIEDKLTQMYKSGTTSIGAISSYGFEMQACINSPINVVYFNEVIGSKGDMVDTLFTDFNARLGQSLSNKSKSFIPGVAIHSPYSVHPFLLREALNVARQSNLRVTAHFLESNEEKEWLEKDSGGFLSFFENFLGQTSSVTTPLEFLNQFKNIENLSFTHCVEANEDEFKKIKELNATINHCVTSNRLLNNSILNLNNLKDINYSIGTDGLSSNNSLSMFDELRNALMMHSTSNLNDFASELLVAATKGGAKSLGLNKGELSKHKDADMILFNLPDELKDETALSTHIILHTNEVEKTIIGGLYV